MKVGIDLVSVAERFEWTKPKVYGMAQDRLLSRILQYENSKRTTKTWWPTWDSCRMIRRPTCRR